MSLHWPSSFHSRKTSHCHSLKGADPQCTWAVILQIFGVFPSGFLNLHLSVFFFWILEVPAIPIWQVSLLPAILPFSSCTSPLSTLPHSSCLQLSNFSGVHGKILELSHSRAMHNQNYPQCMYVLHQHYCSINILPMFYMLSQQIVQPVTPAATIRANGSNGPHRSQT